MTPVRTTCCNDIFDWNSKASNIFVLVTYAAAFCLVSGCSMGGCTISRKKNYPPFDAIAKFVKSEKNSGVVTYGYKDRTLLFACFVLTTNSGLTETPLKGISGGTGRDHYELKLPNGRIMELPQREQTLIEVSDGVWSIQKNNLSLETFTRYLELETNAFSLQRLFHFSASNTTENISRSN